MWESRAGLDLCCWLGVDAHLLCKEPRPHPGLESGAQAGKGMGEPNLD
jgi:hypothetical protein